MFGDTADGLEMKRGLVENAFETSEQKMVSENSSQKEERDHFAIKEEMGIDSLLDADMTTRDANVKDNKTTFELSKYNIKPKRKYKKESLSQKRVLKAANQPRFKPRIHKSPKGLDGLSNSSKAGHNGNGLKKCAVPEALKEEGTDEMSTSDKTRCPTADAESKVEPESNFKELFNLKQVVETKSTNSHDDAQKGKQAADGYIEEVKIQDIRIRHQKVEMCGYGRTFETKRYLKLYRLLSSALGYSWTYKEICRRKKQFQLNVNVASCNEEPTTEEPYTNLPKAKLHKVNRIEKNPDGGSACGSSRVMDNVNDVKADNNPGKADYNIKQAKRKLPSRSKRIRPYGIVEKPATRKTKMHHIHERHWTDSKF